MKYLVRERIFGIGDDFWIQDEEGRRAFLVDGKAMRIRETFELRDPSDTVVAVIRKKLVSIRDTMVIERDGEKLATVRRKRFSPIHHAYEAELSDGSELRAAGDFLDKEYDIEADGQLVASISRKWFSLRDTYAVDVLEGADPALVLSIAVCIDRLAHEEG